MITGWEKKEQICSMLADEQSKEIYRLRCKYYDTKDITCFHEIIDKYVPEYRDEKYYDKKELLLEEVIRQSKYTVMFGAGARGMQLLNTLSAKDISVEILVDNSTEAIGTTVAGFCVQSPVDIDVDKVDCVVVTPHGTKVMESIREQLLAMGIAEEKIYFYRHYIFSGLEKQYFEDEIIEYNDYEFFVDAGSLNLGTSLEFIERAKNAGTKTAKVVAFEPNREAFADCNRIAGMHNEEDITIYNAGLWSRDTRLHFIEGSTGDSRVSDEETELSIDVMALDLHVKEPVTFIKMDIEGAEMEALKGCANIIKKDKPKLAICIYHKQEDLIDIPLYVKELVPEYKLYVRHYSNCNSETVLYAVLD